MVLKKFKIGVIGLGYVGQPLLIELSNYFSVIGFDLNNKKIDKINRLKISKLNNKVFMITLNCYKNVIYLLFVYLLLFIVIKSLIYHFFKKSCS